MGVDIEVVVECDASPSFDKPFGIALLNWSRQRALFGAMGYRNESAAPSKGFPAPASYLARHRHALQVVEDHEVCDSFQAGLPAISLAEALQAIEAGGSHFLTAHGPDLIANPAHVWPNWLTLSEFRNCAQGLALSLECELTLGMLEAIEQRGLHARMVFWFDH